MNKNIQILTTDTWQDYELMDSGDGEKLERFGTYVLNRPEPKAIWQKTLDSDQWKVADALYERDSSGGGQWTCFTKLPPTWTIKWKDITFLIKPTGFKHTGIFPEQSSIWEFIHNKITSVDRPIKFLNLFGYTGGSSLVAAQAGATVTHIDASKDVLTWANENAKLSKLDTKPIRWIPEDTLTFVKREIKRGNIYDAIIMDPPKYGRGTKNEVWKIEEDLPELLDLCTQILSPTPLFVIINAYALSLSSLSLENLLTQTMRKYAGNTTCGELSIKHSGNKLLLPESIFGMWEENIIME